jgi:hypothetical protein
MVNPKHIIINKVYEIPHHLLKIMLLEFYRLKVEEDGDSVSKEPPKSSQLALK